LKFLGLAEDSESDRSSDSGGDSFDDPELIAAFGKAMGKLGATIH
jgi:hypothetical protein